METEDPPEQAIARDVRYLVRYYHVAPPISAYQPATNFTEVLWILARPSFSNFHFEQFARLLHGHTLQELLVSS